MRAVGMRARFTGLYEWGQGWLSLDIRDKWNRYFRSAVNVVGRHSFWHYTERDDGLLDPCRYLVSAGGSVYLHPMDVKYCGTREGVSFKYEGGRHVETVPEIDELKEILIGAAEACGGLVEFTELSFSEIPEPKWEGKEWPEVASK